MRILVFMLALANAAFFAYAWFVSGNQTGGDAHIMSQQLNPERIRLLAPQQVNALRRKTEPAKVEAPPKPEAPKAEPPKPEAPKAEPPKPEAPKAEPPKPEPPKADSAKADPAKAKVVSACLEWGGLAGADVTRAAQALQPLLSGANLTRRTQTDAAGYWVYMPPLPSRHAATQKGGELKRLGINDFFVVTDDPKWRNAVSLGVFKTEDAAKAHLAALRTKGVRTAIVGPRDPLPDKTYFQVHDVTAALAAKLNELKQGFAGSEVHACPAPDKNG